MRKKTFLTAVIMAFLLMSVSVWAGGVIQLPQTGQTKCYDSSGAEISCAGTGQDGEIDKNALIEKVSRIQMPFIENQGQVSEKSVRFYANTFAGTVFVTERGEMVYSLIKAVDGAQTTDTRHTIDNSKKTSELKTHKTVALREGLECPKETDIKGMNKSETTVNYFVSSDASAWKTNIQTWQEVSLGEVYDGIDLKLRAYGKNVEKLFTVHPKGSVDDIRLTLEGAKNLKVNENGELEVETELGTIKFTKPVAFQEPKSGSAVLVFGLNRPNIYH